MIGSRSNILRTETTAQHLYRLKSHEILLRRGAMPRYSKLLFGRILALYLKTVSRSSAYDNKSEF